MGWFFFEMNFVRDTPEDGYEAQLGKEVENCAEDPSCIHLFNSLFSLEDIKPQIEPVENNNDDQVADESQCMYQHHILIDLIPGITLLQSNSNYH